jgi:hypothetical protein
VQHLGRCWLSLFQDEAIVAGPESENQYADAVK